MQFYLVIEDFAMHDNIFSHFYPCDAML